MLHTRDRERWHKTSEGRHRPRRSPIRNRSGRPGGAMCGRWGPTGLRPDKRWQVRGTGRVATERQRTAMTDPRIRVLIADDEELIREALVALLERETDMEVVAIAADGRQAVDRALAHRPDVAVLDHRPDVAVLDLQMP